MVAQKIDAIYGQDLETGVNLVKGNKTQGIRGFLQRREQIAGFHSHGVVIAEDGLEESEGGAAGKQWSSIALALPALLQLLEGDVVGNAGKRLNDGKETLRQ